jgi:hypothetical protein
MKFRFDKKKYASLILMLLMLGSTLAYTALQAFRNLQQPNEAASAPELPPINVVDYEITAEQRNYMLRLGRTILEYRYQLSCTDCAAQRAYIESAAREFPEQVFVEEIIDATAIEPTLSMTSYYGDKLLRNPSNEDVFDALCELMVEPPIRCATRNI